jgi:hypothetical protein
MGRTSQDHSWWFSAALEFRTFAAVSLLIAAMSACSGPAQASRHTGPVAVPASSSRALRATLPTVATVVGSAGSFVGHGSVTVTAAHAELPYAGSLSAAGTGVNVRFSGVRLVRPLVLTFDVRGKPGPEAMPVVAHQMANGSWSLIPATYHAGRMVVRAQDFSVHVPAWLNPKAWMRWLGGRLASLVGGRTAPIDCAGGGPAWASLSRLTDEVHTCLEPNVDRTSHAVRAEVQIKSNRGVALEVDIPPDSAYTWVEDQPSAVRSWIWDHVIHQDPDVMALLPAGGTMTAGYLQPAADESISFQVRPSNWSLGYSLIGDVVDALSGEAAKHTGMITLYLMTKCSKAVDFGNLSVHGPLSSAKFGSAITCVVSQATSNLADPETAVRAARTLLGPGLDQADTATAVKELTSVGSKLIGFAWITILWPYVEAGWGELPDAVHNLLSGGASTLINLDLRRASSPCTSDSIKAGIRASTQPYAKALDDIHGFGCSGQFAYAFADVTSQGIENSITILLLQHAGTWVPVDRASYCLNHAVPGDIYFNACETQ